MNHTKTAAGIALALALTGLFGCSSSSKASSDTGGATTTTPSADSGGTGDTGSTAGTVDVCTKITTDEVAAIVGGPVKKEEVPGGGCSFSQDDPRAPSANFDSTSFTGGAGDYDSAKSGVTGTVEGTPEDAPGIGSKAFVVVGTTMGGTNMQAGGLVAANGHLAQLTVTQGNGLSATDVKAMATKLLTLAADKL